MAVILEYTLSERDLVDLNLYSATQSSQIRERNRLGRWGLTVMCLSVASYGFAVGNLILGSIVVAFLIVLQLLHPWWELRHYTQHYRRYVAEQQSEFLNEKMRLSFTDGAIESSDAGSEVRVKSSELKELVELPTLILISLGATRHFVVPKRAIGPETILNIQRWAAEERVRFNDQTGWKW